MSIPVSQGWAATIQERGIYAPIPDRGGLLFELIGASDFSRINRNSFDPHLIVKVGPRAPSGIAH